MSAIGAFEAKNTLGSLLDRVEKGEEITITRRGTPVAKLVPANPGFDRARALVAVQAMRELADSINAPKLGWEEIKKMRDEGRR
jgi:prevent-host-death family protein